MKRIISMAMMGLFIATAAWAQGKHDSPPVKKDNPIFSDTIPDRQEQPPVSNPPQIQPEDTTHNPWVTEPANRKNRQRRTDTTFPGRTDTLQNQKQYQKMDTTSQERMDTSYPERTDTLSQPPLNHPAMQREQNRRRKRATPPLQHRDNPPMTDTSSGGRL